MELAHWWEVDTDAPGLNRVVMERFNRDLLPWIERYGPKVGEEAMQGDDAAYRLIARYRVFAILAMEDSADPDNLRRLENCIKNYVETRTS